MYQMPSLTDSGQQSMGVARSLAELPPGGVPLANLVQLRAR